MVSATTLTVATPTDSSTRPAPSIPPATGSFTFVCR